METTYPVARCRLEQKVRHAPVACLSANRRSTLAWFEPPPHSRRETRGPDSSPRQRAVRGHLQTRLRYSLLIDCETCKWRKRSF